MEKQQGFGAWIDARLPTLKREWNRHMAEYYAPKNFNWWYYFGVLSMVVLVIQLHITNLHIKVVTVVLVQSLSNINNG